MNILLINILAVVICLVIGYFFGSIPTAVWVGKIFFHQDPRDYGSHNAGGTNAGRLWGKKVGFIIICLDMLKTVVPMYLVCVLLTFIKWDYSNISGITVPFELTGVVSSHRGLCATVLDYYKVVNGVRLNSVYAIQWPVYYIVVVGTMIGHCWPIFAKFKGGKAASQFMGITVLSSWMLGFLPGFFYLGTLKWKKYVSLSAILQAAFVSTITWIWVILVLTKVIPGNLAWLPMYGPLLNPDITYACTVTFIGAVMIARHHENIKRIREGTERKIKWMK